MTLSRLKPNTKLRVVGGRSGPSRSFIELTRNIELAEQAPRRFVPTVKGPHDVVI